MENTPCVGDGPNRLRTERLEDREKDRKAAIAQNVARWKAKEANRLEQRKKAKQNLDIQSSNSSRAGPAYKQRNKKDFADDEEQKNGDNKGMVNKSNNPSAMKHQPWVGSQELLQPPPTATPRASSNDRNQGQADRFSPISTSTAPGGNLALRNPPALTPTIKLGPELVRPTYTRMNRRHLSLETLDYFKFEYELDHDPNYVLVKQWLPESEQEKLWRHSEILRSQRPPTPLLLENAGNRPVYTRMARKHLSLETLRHFNEDFEVDYDPEYVLIKRIVPEPDQDRMWEHTKVIRSQRPIPTRPLRPLSESGSGREMWTKISLDDCSIGTARKFKLSYEIDMDTNSILIKKKLLDSEVTELVAHTKANPPTPTKMERTSSPSSADRSSSQPPGRNSQWNSDAAPEVSLETAREELAELKYELAESERMEDYARSADLLYYQIPKQEALIEQIENEAEPAPIRITSRIYPNRENEWHTKIPEPHFHEKALLEFGSQFTRQDGFFHLKLPINNQTRSVLLRRSDEIRESEENAKITLIRRGSPALEPDIKTVQQLTSKILWKSEPQIISTLSPTISRDLTKGEEARHAELLAEYGRKKCNLAPRSVPAINGGSNQR